MLDDLKMIHERDAEDALGVAEKQWQQLLHNFEFTAPDFGEILNVVLAGMGGSALPGVFFKSWPDTKVPFEIVRDYSLPKYVGPQTLVISSSYSGNTEETLSALADAESKGAKIVVVAAGGKLAELANEKQLPLLMIPGGIQPRMSAFYFLNAFLHIFEALNLVEQGTITELQEVGHWLKDQPHNWKAEVPTAHNPAKQLAQNLMGNSVVVYSGPKMYPAANKFKIGCNENGKNVAWLYQYPEFNHNEFIGWTSHPTTKPYAVVEIRSNLEHERVQKRYVVSERLLSGKRPAPHVITPVGDTLLQQLLWSSTYCDFVSLYLAQLNGIDPTPVGLVEKFKKALDE